MQNAGVRVYDIRNQYRPVEVGGLRPAEAAAHWSTIAPTGRW